MGLLVWGGEGETEKKDGKTREKKVCNNNNI